MSSVENKYAAIKGPISATGITGKEGVFAVTSSGATAQGFRVPDAWKGQFVTCTTTGSNCHIAFGTGSTFPALVYGSFSTVNARGDITSSVARGTVLFDGVSRDFICPSYGKAGDRTVDVWCGYVYPTVNSTGSLEILLSEQLNKGV